ncbi:MAG: insulinase family protein, partial [Deltaproteobacteria bacterium]|nr:insulinase family protein [Deltaproteobacteria bacterium]
MKRITFVVVILASALLLASCASAPPKPEERVAPTPASAPASAPAVEAAPEPVPASEAWRATPPRAGALPKLVIPTIQQATLPNGLTVLVSEQHQLPFISVQAAFRAGAALDPENQPGLANLVYEMLPEGTGKRDAVALADAFGDLGSRLGEFVGDDGGGLHFAVLSRNLDPAVGLLAEVVQRPRFDAKDFERRQKKVLADLVRSLGDPMYLAFDAAGGEIFGATHPYGHSTGGTMASVKALKVEDVKRFYAANVGPRTAALVFAGDITLQQARKLAQKHFGKWKGKARPPQAPAAPAAEPRSRVVVVAKPGLEQTVLAAGRPGIARGDGDEWPLELATSVFGGMFTSRLNMNLREDKG